MDTILLSWRIQNVLAIGVIILGVGLVLAVGGQIIHKLAGTVSKEG